MSIVTYLIEGQGKERMIHSYLGTDSQTLQLELMLIISYHH